MTAALTFDVDWAPEWAIEAALDACAGQPATFFVTHRSAALSAPTQDLELGLHPNLLPGSTHGVTPAEVIATCLGYAPGARSMRTHALVQSSPIHHEILGAAPQLEIDVSLFLYLHEHLRPFDLWWSDRRLRRLPYMWEDDVAAVHPGWSWSSAPTDFGPGMQIFDFHPIHVALNTDTLDRYSAWRRSLGTTPMTDAPASSIDEFRNPGVGVRTFLDRLVAARHDWQTVSAIADQAAPCG